MSKDQGTGKKILWLIFGLFFGMALSQVGASDFARIYGMFRLTDLTLYGVIGSAVIVGGLGMQLLQKHGKSRDGSPLAIDKAKLTWRHLLGGLIFGAGWAMTGACPGTVATQLGEGKILAFFTFAGILFGTWLYARAVERFPKLLPPQAHENS